MRNDLTAAFLAKMAASHRTPIQLAVFHFETFGDIYVSDRDIVVDGKLYKGLVESWGELTTSGGTTGTSGTMELSLSLWNGGDFPFSAYFASEDPVNTFVDLYQTFEGLDPEDIAVIGSFVIQDPITYGEGDRLLNLDLVTTNMRYFAQVGELVTKKRFPYALERDINKSLDLMVGEVGEVNAVCTSTPPRTTQSGSILKLPTKVYSAFSLDEKEFLSYGYIQIDAEIMYYSSRTDDYFNVTMRGYLPTIAVDHVDGSEIIQVRTNNIGPYTEYAVGQGPVDSIDNVLVKGQTPTISYTVHPKENPAVIRFLAQPTFEEYSRGARSGEVAFNESTASNTAYKPHYAYNTEFRAYGALIDKSQRKLALINTLNSIDEGQVIRIFLVVDHWATEQYANDIIQVYMTNVAFLGNLSKPSPEDILSLQADIDLDHGHTHEQGGFHNHPLVEPTLGLNDPSHLHGGQLAGPTTQDGGRVSGQYGLPYTVATYNKTATIRMNYPVIAGIKTQSLRLRWTATGNTGNGSIQLTGGGQNVRWPAGISAVDQIFNITPGTTQIELTSYQGAVVGGGMTMVEATMTFELDSSISYNYSGVSGQVNKDGSVTRITSDEEGKLMKDLEDVKDFSGDNIPIENISTFAPSKSTIDRFDVTEQLEIAGWDTMKDQEFFLYYSGSVNDAGIVITGMHFEVEFRQRQTKTTDDISANVVGSIDPRPDAVIQYLLTEKAGVPLEKLGSVWRSVPIWDDSEIWDDNEIWQDEGQVAGVPEGSAFEEAGAWFHSHGYQIDGAIAGDLSVKDAVSKLTFQTRSKLEWQNGLAKLAILKQATEWRIAKDLGTDIIQLRSLVAEKTDASEILNNIDLFYDLDRLTTVAGASAYKESASRIDQPSINKHGERKDDIKFEFDLIRCEACAELTADYYIWLYGESRTRYYFRTYLPNFDIEKTDYITISSTGFERLNKTQIAVTDSRRVFGSGKNQLINTLDLVGESIRHKRLLGFLEEEEVVCNDALSIYLGTGLDFEDSIGTSDQLLVNIAMFPTEEVVISDSELLILMYNTLLEEEIVEAQSLLTSNHKVVLESNVTVIDNLNPNREACFGACGFGGPGCSGILFGSKTAHNELTTENQTVEDILTTNDKPYLEEEAVATDNVVFGDGFGCPSGNGSGFGLAPFGDPSDSC